MKRRIASAAALTAMALATLTGCFKIDYDLTVHEDNTMDGTIVMAFEKEFAEEMGEESEGAMSAEDLAALEEVGATVEVKDYDDGTHVGQEITFTDMPVEKLGEAFASTDDAEAAPTGAEEFSVTRDGDEFTFVMKADTAAATGGGESTGDAETDAMMQKMYEEMMEDASFTVSVTMPGKVTDSNGTVDGSTVTWDIDLTKGLDLRATSDASQSGFPVLPVAVLLGVVAAGAALFFFVIRPRLAARGSEDEQPVAAQAPLVQQATPQQSAPQVVVDDPAAQAQPVAQPAPQQAPAPQPVPQVAPGWYPTNDPTLLRYHDGTQWTQHTHPVQGG